MGQDEGSGRSPCGHPQLPAGSRCGEDGSPGPQGGGTLRHRPRPRATWCRHHGQRPQALTGGHGQGRRARGARRLPRCPCLTPPPLPPSCCPAPISRASSPRWPASSTATTATSSMPSSTRMPTKTCSSSGSSSSWTASTLAREEIAGAFAPVAERFEMHVDLRFSDEPSRVALLASQQPHCLYDLLTRWRTGELAVDIPARHQQPPRPRRRRRLVRRRVPPPARHPGHQAGPGGTGASGPARPRHRPRRAGPLHADPHAVVHRRVAEPDHQHPPLVPARIHRRAARTTRRTTGA